MNCLPLPHWVSGAVARFSLLALLWGATTMLRGESAQYSFEGTLQGELPLEVEFLSLARKHGLNVNAIVSGTLTVRSAETVFDPVGTSSVELKLVLGQIQELSARLQSDAFYRGLKGKLRSGAHIEFAPHHISIKDPSAFPARIGLPSPTGQDSAFVLEGISIQLDPSFLAELGKGADALVGTLSGKVTLKKKGGKDDGKLAELDFSVTHFKKKASSLWDSQEWKSVATVMDQMNAGFEGVDLPVLPAEEGDDGLILIPEPAAFGLLAGLLGAASVLLRRRRPSARAHV